MLANIELEDLGHEHGEGIGQRLRDCCSFWNRSSLIVCTLIPRHRCADALTNKLDKRHCVCSQTVFPFSILRPVQTYPRKLCCLQDGTFCAANGSPSQGEAQKIELKGQN